MVVTLERRGDRDQEGVCLDHVAGGPKSAESDGVCHGRIQIRLHDVGPASVDRRDGSGIDVDADDRNAVTRKYSTGRQSDVAQSNDGHSTFKHDASQFTAERVRRAVPIASIIEERGVENSAGMGPPHRRALIAATVREAA